MYKGEPRRLHLCIAWKGRRGSRPSIQSGVDFRLRGPRSCDATNCPVHNLPSPDLTLVTREILSSHKIPDFFDVAFGFNAQETRPSRPHGSTHPPQNEPNQLRTVGDEQRTGAQQPVGPGQETVDKCQRRHAEQDVRESDEAEMAMNDSTLTEQDLVGPCPR